MSKETKLVTVTWSEQVWKENTIRVPVDETDEEKLFELAHHDLGSRTMDSDVIRETITVEVEND